MTTRSPYKTLVRILDPALVQTEDGAIWRDGKIRIRSWSGVKQLASVPRPTSGEARANCQALAYGACWISEEHWAGWVANHASLANWLNEHLVPCQVAKALATVDAPGHGPVLGATMVARVQVQSPVVQLGDRALVGALSHYAADAPGSAVVVTHDDMRVMRISPSVEVATNDVIARHH